MKRPYIIKIVVVIIFLCFTSCSFSAKNSVVNLFSKNSIIISESSLSPSLFSSGVVSWSFSGDYQPNIDHYEVCLGTDPGLCNITNWINIGSSSYYNFNVHLQASTRYYANIKYFNRDTQAYSDVYFGTGFLSPSNKIVDVAVGRNHTCALTLSGDVKCWGDNALGEIGANDTGYRGHTSGSMATLQYLNLGQPVKSIQANTHHTCAILLDDSLKCWGANNSGQLGYDDFNNRGQSFASIAGLLPINLGQGVKQVAPGYGHTCAILMDNSLKCWGANDYGQLGYDDYNWRGYFPGSMASLSTVNVGSGLYAKQITAGQNHTCALLQNNNVKCWGRNDHGELGYDDLISRGHSPGDMAALSYVNLGGPVAQISAGRFNTCALLVSGVVKCWGWNAYGQLGYDDATQRGHLPGDMANLPAVNLGLVVKNIVTAYGSTCAILSDDSIKCWGYGGWGTLGYNNTVTQGSFVGSMAALGKVNIGQGVKSLAMQTGHVCAILVDHELKCWGWNFYGQLGYDDVANRGNSPGSIESLLNINLNL